MRIIGNDPSVPRQTQEVASGTLPNGKPVVVNADGTVSAVSATGGGAAFGTPVVFNDAESIYESATFDSNSNKVVISYRDSAAGDNGYAVVGTVSGSSISFGTPVAFNSGTGSTNYTAITFDSNSNKVVIAYQDGGNSSYGTAIVGTVSGDSISFGTEVVFNSGNSDFITSTFDSSNNKVVIAYRDQGNNQYGTAVVGTVSGTSISFGSEVVYNSTFTTYNGSTFDSNSNKVVIVYRNDGNSSYGTAIVGTVSGSSISFGTAVVFESARADGNVATFDSNSNKVVVAYQDPNNTDAVQAIVGTVSGTSISFGTAAVIDTNAYIYIAISFDSNVNKVLVSYVDSGNSNYGTAAVGTVSGTSISFGTPIVFSASNSQNAYIASTFDSNSNAIVVAYRDAGNSNYGEAVVFQGQSTNLTSENYIGMSSGPTGVTEAQTQEIGTPASYYTTAATAYTTAVFDTNSNKVVFSFRGSGDDGTSIVGTVDPSNNSMSFGSAVVWNTDESIYIKSAFDSNSNKVVIVYRDEGNSQYGTAVVGTVSGNSISFGSDVVFESAAVDHLDVAFDSSNNKVVIAFRDRGDDFDGKAIVGTVSGTSISFGSAAVFNDGAVTTNIYMNTVFDSNSNKVVIGWGIPGKARVGTVSGTSISFGSEVTFESGNIDHFSSAFDSSNNKVVYAYRDEGNSNYGTAVVGTVSGTSISFGTPVVFESATVSGTGTTFDTTTNKINIFYTDDGNSGYATVIVGTVSGTSISFGTPVAFENEDSSQYGATFDSNSNRAVCGYNGNSSRGTSIVFKNAGDYPVTGEVADGGHALIDTQGAISDNQGGLTAGQSYYVQTDGTIGTTADDPSVFAGTAVSATKLIVKG